LPGLAELSEQIHNVTGLELDERRLYRIGRDITGLERMINHRLGVRRRDDTLPNRWFDDPITTGSYAGETIDRAEFQRLLDRFYAVTGLNDEGQPASSWRARILRRALGFAVVVQLPPDLQRPADDAEVVQEPVTDVGELLEKLAEQRPDLAPAIADGTLTVAVNDTVVVHDRDNHAIHSGDHLELLPLVGGG
jgi:aldehyde:ferredoxin oxidoreductase